MYPLPKSNFETIWSRMWQIYDVDKDIPRLAREFNFPTTAYEPISFALFILHRMVALGFHVPDEELGSWIEQHGAHLAICGIPYNANKHEFHFTKGKKYTERQITYHELTGWILNPKFAKGAVQWFTKLCDDAIAALIDYKLDCDDAKWDTFKAKMKTASTPPW